MAFFGRGIFVLAAVIAALQTASAAGPDWSLAGYSNIPSTVREIKTEGDAVLIKINTGSMSGLAIGSVCYVYRSDAFITQAVVVEAKRDVSVAKVLSDEAVLSGDQVYIKRQPDLQ